MRRIGLLGAFLVLACTASTARADIVYQYVADTTSFTLSSGGQASTNIYLQETISGSSQSFLASEHGLFGAGFSASRTAGDSGMTFAGNVTGSNSFQGGAFSHTDIAAGGTNPKTGNITEGLPVSSVTGVSGTVAGLVTKVLIGSITITAGSTDSTFNVDARNGLNSTTVTFDHRYGLDTDTKAGTSAPANGPFSLPEGYSGTRDLAFNITVSGASAVPEPSSMLLCGFAVIGGGFAAYRRRMAKGAEVAETPAVA